MLCAELKRHGTQAINIKKSGEEMKNIGRRLEELERIQPTGAKPFLAVYEHNGEYWTGEKSWQGKGGPTYHTRDEVEAMRDDYEVCIVSYVDNWRSTDNVGGSY